LFTYYPLFIVCKGIIIKLVTILKTLKEDASHDNEKQKRARKVSRAFAYANTLVDSNEVITCEVSSTHKMTVTLLFCSARQENQ
jgi:hypothetical protein